MDALLDVGLDAAVPVLLAVVGLLAVLGWRLRDAARLVISAAMVLGLGCAAALLHLTADAAPATDGEIAAGVCLAGLLAVAGGGVVTSAIFALVDGPRSHGVGTVLQAGDVLRGGAWIGALERIAVFVTLVGGWPEGVAVTLALKGLGRYPELRVDRPGATERFIIGTFSSVLWAIGCAGLAHLMR